MTNREKSPYPDTPGIFTFMGVPEGDVEHLDERMVAIAGVSYDLSCTGRVGARFGPRAYRDASQYYATAFRRDELLEIVGDDRMKRPEGVGMLDLGDLTVYPLDWPKTQIVLRDSMSAIASRGAMPIILGGDHLITAALVQGYAEAVRQRTGGKIGYVQFSSQLDLADEDAVWGRVWRGTTARRIIDAQAVDPKNMAWVGTSGYLRLEEWEFARKHNLRLFTLNEIRRRGIVQVVEHASELAGDGCESIYVSVDFDVLDGGYVPMQATPRFEGLTNIELLTAMDVLRRTKAGALDLVGLNPTVNMVSMTGQRFGVWLIIRFLATSALATLSPAASQPNADL